MRKLLGTLIVTGALGLFVFLFSEEKLVVPDAVIQETPEVAAMPIVEEEETENVSTKPSLARVETETVLEDQRPENDPIGSKDGPDVFLVTRVIDGDTIEIEGGEKVRYIGVNTPESVDPRRKVQCFGKEAAAYNKKLVEGNRVRLEPDVEDRDKYHRLLRYVWLGDTMINEKLVSDGYAQVMTIPPNVKYVDRFRAAQTQAREAKRGLWNKCKK